MYINQTLNKPTTSELIEEIEFNEAWMGVKLQTVRFINLKLCYHSSLYRWTWILVIVWMNACDSRHPPSSHSLPRLQGWTCVSWSRTAQFQLITAELWRWGHGWSWHEAGTPHPPSWPHTEATLSDLHDWRQPLSQQWVIQELTPPPSTPHPFMLHQLELRVSRLHVFL